MGVRGGVNPEEVRGGCEGRCKPWGGQVKCRGDVGCR